MCITGLMQRLGLRPHFKIKSSVAWEDSEFGSKTWKRLDSWTSQFCKLYSVLHRPQAFPCVVHCYAIVEQANKNLDEIYGRSYW
jgi:hypothetical protein